MIDRGSAMSLALSYYVVLTLLVVYIYCSRVYTDTWDGLLFSFCTYFSSVAKLISYVKFICGRWHSFILHFFEC